MLNLPFKVPNNIVWPFSKGSLSQIRAISGIIKVADTKNKLVKSYKEIKVLVRCQSKENLRG
jgi:hypothetical protein